MSFVEERGGEGVPAAAAGARRGLSKTNGWIGHRARWIPSLLLHTVAARPVLPDDPDCALLWQIVNKNNQNRYVEYQKRTSRPIPVVVPTPTG